MPGLFGTLGGTDNQRRPGIAVIGLELCRHTGDRLEKIPVGNFAEVAMLLPQGCSWAIRHSTATSPTVALYGEVFRDAAPALEGMASDLAACSWDDVARVLDRFDGSFSGLVCWPSEARGVLFTDHCASRPVYYREAASGVWFAPEPKALRALDGLATSLDVSAVAAFLTCGQMLDDLTFYREIRTLPPGTLLRVAGAKCNVSRYCGYHLADAGAPDRGEAAHKQKLHTALRQAIARRVSRLGDCVIPISGGWDSRGILAYVRTVYDGPLKTVSWGTTEDEPEADAAIGRQLSRHFGSTHVFMRRDPDRLPDTIYDMVSWTDAMTTDPFFHYQELEFMCRLRGELGVSYLLRGDEIFGYMAPAVSEPEALARVGVRRLAEFPDLVSVINPDARKRFVTDVDAVIARISASCPLKDYTARKDYHYFHQRLWNYLHRANYFKLGVFDSSNPWLDRSILAVNAETPIPYRIDKDLYKRTIAGYFPEVHVPFAKRNSLENWPELLSRNRRIREFLFDHLRQRNSPVFDFLMPAVVEHYMAAAVAGRQRQSVKVRTLAAIKDLIQKVSPGVYRAVRKQASGKVKAAHLPTADLLARALVLKLWFDRFPPVSR